MLFNKIKKKYLLGTGLAVLVVGSLSIGGILGAELFNNQTVQAVTKECQPVENDLIQYKNLDNPIQENKETEIKQIPPQAKTKAIKKKSKRQNERNNEKINQTKKSINEKEQSDNLKESAKQKPRQENIQAEKPTEKKESEEKTESKSESVYITKNGNCYHKYGCKHLKKSKIQIDKKEAEKNFKPCKDCHPK